MNKFVLILSVLIIGLSVLAPAIPLVRIVLAALPLILVLYLMIGLRWSVQRAGPAAWFSGVVITILAFGLTPEVFWISQARGLLLSFYVLLVLYPALLLYHVANESGGIRAIAQGLEHTITDRGMLLVVTAWAFSGMLEGLAGFGLPIAIVAPILGGLGVEPVLAVAVVAVGHAWSVTFGDMGVIYQTLTAVTQMEGAQIAPTAALMLGIVCLACGLAVLRLLGEGRLWRQITVLALLMGGIQYALAVVGLPALGALGGGLAGVIGGILLGRRTARSQPSEGVQPTSSALLSVIFTYGLLAAILSLITLIGPLHDTLNSVVWQLSFPQVSTRSGLITPAGGGTAFRFLTHPGPWMLIMAILSYALNRRIGLVESGSWRRITATTWRSALPSCIAVISMVGLSTLMEHSGMTQLLAQALSDTFGAAFPLLSPLVGILGAFATGSNNNSNVLFGLLQKNAALLLSINPSVLIAAQTAGGALGSMLAPAKLAVGSSTLGMKGRDGEVLRLTVPYGIGIGLLIGVVALLLAR
jgi:lactate permease